MIKIRRASAVAIGAAAVLAIGGTAAFAAGADDPSPSPTSGDGGAVPMLPNGDTVPSPSFSDDASPSPSPSVSTSTAPPATSASPIGIAAAKSIAIRAAGGGRVTKVESGVEHGRAVWDVDVVVQGVEHDIDVDKKTGAVTRHRVKGSSGGGAKVRVSHEAGDDNHRNRGGNEAGDDHGGRGSDD
jgi:hypothetical protein